MKKFLIALCGILVVGNALGRTMYTPKPVAHNMASTWQVGGTYEDKLIDEYPQLDSQLNNEKGTFGTDEGAIVLVMARKIYDNGGYFCATQIQAGNINGRRYVWIDYIEDNKFLCTTVCKPGFFGTNCEKSSGVVAVNDKKLNFGIFDVVTSGRESNIITESTEVFSAANQTRSDIRTAKHVILGMVKLLDHGMIVAPIEITAERDTTGSGGIHSRITSANSNGNTTLLCRSGYYANGDKTDCVSRAQHVAETLCDGFSGYVEGMHTKYQESSSSKCSKFYCTQSGYGFTSANDKTCIPCNGGELAYVNADGLCDTCQKGEYPRSSGNGCDSQMETYSQIQMKSGPNGNRECWLETDPEKFGGCVICSTNNQCWNGKNCTTCD